MPTIFRKGPYRFFFYSGDGAEPVHIHVEKDGNIAKFWIEPVRLAWSGGYDRVEMLKVQKIIEENDELIVEAWDEFFGN